MLFGNIEGTGERHNKNTFYTKKNRNQYFDILKKKIVNSIYLFQ